MATAQYLKLRLFLEGQEVPVIGASVTASLGSPAQASIQVVGDPSVLRLAPRTLVHLFVYDPLGRSKLHPKSSDGKYILLFCGDLMEVQYQKTGSSRNATLVCVDDTSYYDLAYTYFYTEASIRSNNIQILTRERAAFVGAKTGRTDVVGASLGLGKLLNTVFDDPVPRTFGLKDLKGLLGAVVRILEQFMGVDDVSAGGVNQFFSMHARRKRLLQQITMLPEDRIAVKLLSSQFIINFIKKKADQLGDLVTARQLVKYVLGFIYYDLIPLPSPKYEPSRRIKKKLPPKASLRMSAVLDKILHRLETLDEFVGLSSDAYVTESYKPGRVLKVSEGFEPDADVLVFKNIANTKEYVPMHAVLKTFMENLINIAVLYKVKRADPSVNISQIVADTTSRMFSLADIIKDLEVPEVVEVTADVSFNDRLNTTGIIPDLFFGVAPTCNVLYPDMYTSLSYSRSMGSEASRLHLSTGIDRELLGTSGADNLTYYAPSIDEFKQIQSQSVVSAKANEINTGINLAMGRLFDHELYTGIIPAFSRVDRIAYTAALAKANKSKAEAALRKQGVGGTQQKGGQSASILQNSFQSETEFTESERDDFFVRIANYQYIKKRLAKRSASVSGLLNPNAAVGFPMIIIDGVPTDGAGDLYASPSDASDNNESYIGLLTTITHNVSQQAAGSTSYELSYVRPHRNRDDEFLSELSTLDRVDTANAEKRNVKLVPLLQSFINNKAMQNDDVLRDLIVALLCTTAVGKDTVGKVSTTAGNKIDSPKFPGLSAGETVMGKRILGIEVIKSEEVFSKDAVGLTYAEQQVDVSAKGASVYIQRAINQHGPNLKSNGLDSSMRAVLTRLLSTQPQTLSRDDIRALYVFSLNATKRLMYPAYAEINIYYFKAGASSSALPIEEAIRPRYIDDSYSSPHIGKYVYDKILGVGSVIDSTLSKAKRLKAPTAKFSVSPGQLGNPSQSGSVVEVISQETAVDILAHEYASRGLGAEFSFKKVNRPIATLPDILGSGGFHSMAFASSNADKPLSLVQDLVYDRDTKQCPPGYNKATKQQVEDILSRVNPKLDVREARYKLVSAYISGLRSKGKLG